MKLPFAELAIVDRSKICDYLLNFSHPDGGDKARFFFQFGFSQADIDALASSLLEHCQKNEVARFRLTEFGMRYEVDGQLATPSGLWPQVRTVWQVDHEEVAPRLLTAHPLKSKS